MAGKTKIKIYQYNLEGKFLNEYDSISDVRNKYFPKDTGKRPLFTKDKNYKIIYNIIISTEKLGRNKIREIVKRENNPYLNLGKIKVVEVYNLDMVKIGEFASMSITSKMTNIALPTLHHRLNKGSKHGTTDGLYFKYK